MKKLDILKTGAEILVSTGVGAIVGNAIRMTANPEANKFTRVAIAVGGFVLSGMVSDLATKYVNGIIDDVAEKVNEILSSDEDAKDEEIDETANEGSAEPPTKEESLPEVLVKKDIKKDTKEGASE